MQQHIKVFVIDENPLSRTGLTTLLKDNAGTEIVGTARNLQDAARLLGRLKRCIVIYVIETLNDTARDDVILCRQRWPQLRLLTMIKSVGRQSSAAELVTIGASGVILIDDLESLPSAVSSLANGGPWYSSRLLPALFQEAEAGRLTSLTEKEVEVLMLIAKGLRNAEVAEHLFVSTKTAEFHVHNILAKLGAKSRTEAVHRAYQEGIISPE